MVRAGSYIYWPSNAEKAGKFYEIVCASY